MVKSAPLMMTGMRLVLIRVTRGMVMILRLMTLTALPMIPVPPMSLPMIRALLTRPLATITRNPALVAILLALRILAILRRLTIWVLPTLTIVEALILAPLATN